MLGIEFWGLKANVESQQDKSQVGNSSYGVSKGMGGEELGVVLLV